MKYLRENSVLSKGIFWIVNQSDISSNKDYCFTIPCDSDGNAFDSSGLTAKTGTTHNHKIYWSKLPTRYTHNKPYDYFPRGRVEIVRGKATIYLNPNIYTEEVKKLIMSEFNLTAHNGINRVVFKPDYSEHYKCYLDR